jgi:hypothetical protein
MPYYKPQWYDNIDPTKENFLEPLPTIPNYKLNIEFSNGIPKVSTSYNGPNIYFNFISAYEYTTFAESGIASQFEEYCQTPLTPIIHIKPSIKILYIILIVFGGVVAILLLSLMIWFFIKKYRGNV